MSDLKNFNFQHKDVRPVYKAIRWIVSFLAFAVLLFFFFIKPYFDSFDYEKYDKQTFPIYFETDSSKSPIFLTLIDEATHFKGVHVFANFDEKNPLLLELYNEQITDLTWKWTFDTKGWIRTSYRLSLYCDSLNEVYHIYIQYKPANLKGKKTVMANTVKTLPYSDDFVNINFTKKDGKFLLTTAYVDYWTVGSNNFFFYIILILIFMAVSLIVGYAAARYYNYKSRVLFKKKLPKKTFWEYRGTLYEGNDYTEKVFNTIEKHPDIKVVQKENKYFALIDYKGITSIYCSYPPEKK